MFGSNKKDPLVDAVAKVMQENQVRRDVERQVNETYGIHSKKSLPFEKHDEYDRVLAEKTHQALNEELKGNQSKIDANHNGKIDGQDFKLLRAKKGQMNEDDLDKFDDDDKKKSDKKQKTYTFRHKTSGKEVVLSTKTHKNPDEWKLVSEDSSSDPDFAAPRPDNTKKAGDIVFKSGNDSTDRGAAATKEPSVPTPTKRPDNLKEAKYSAKAARAGEDIGKPGKNFEKIAQKAGEKYESEERGKKVAGAILAKIRAKHMKEEEQLDEKAPSGDKFERMVKHIKKGYSKDGKLTDKEKSIAYATAWKAKNKEDK